jgi:hypothetical protein
MDSTLFPFVMIALCALMMVLMMSRMRRIDRTRERDQ